MLNANPLLRRMITCWSLIAGIIIVGTFGYMVLEGWETQDGFYMTVITLSTVGFGETHELSPVGRLFTSGLIFTSIVCVSMWTASLTSLFVEGELSGGFRRKRTIKMVSSLSGHTIVCGSSTLALTVVERLSRKRAPVVVLDDNSAQLELIRRRFPRVPIIEMSAIDELSLADANVLMAKTVVAALDSDFDNLLIAMTCKDLGTNVQVIARSDDLRVASRMKRAGVDEVICPHQLSGEHIAQLVTNDAAKD